MKGNKKMNWVLDNLQILATLGSALAVYIAIRHAASKEIISLKEEIKEMRVEFKEEIKEIKVEVKDIKSSLQNLDSRVSRIEGQLIGSPRFEPRILEKKEE